MSCRSGYGQTRAATVGPQPLKATIPYQLASKPRSSWRDGQSGKAKAQQLSCGMRRTVSLDAIIGPYLQGHWPKEPEGLGSLSRKDKSTQTPDAWLDQSSSPRNCGIHKRSASWGSAEHLREITKLKQQLQQQQRTKGVSGGHDRERQRNYPQGSYSLGATQPIPIPLLPLSTLAPRLRCSVEGLNQELEGVFISQPHQQHRFLEVPDGHRAPVPPQNYGGRSQSEPLSTPMSSSSPPSLSPCSLPTQTSTFPPISDNVLVDQVLLDSADTCLPSLLSSHSEADHSMPLLISSSPGPNKSCCFQREPPEGCEKVLAWEEISAPHKPKTTLISSCPDPNKVNFTPHGGSAFCPVSLLKPLLPAMDLLFRSRAVSPANTCLTQGTTSRQATPSSNLSPTPDPPATIAIVEGMGHGLAF